MSRLNPVAPARRGQPLSDRAGDQLAALLAVDPAASGAPSVSAFVGPFQPKRARPGWLPIAAGATTVATAIAAITVFAVQRGPAPARSFATPAVLTAEVVASTPSAEGHYGPSVTLLVTLPTIGAQDGYAAFRVWSADNEALVTVGDAALPTIGSTFSFVSTGPGAYEFGPSQEMPFYLSFTLLESEAAASEFATGTPGIVGSAIRVPVDAGSSPEADLASGTGLAAYTVECDHLAESAPDWPFPVIFTPPTEPVGAVFYAQGTAPFAFESRGTGETPVEPAEGDGYLLYFGSFALGAAGNDREAVISALGAYEADPTGESWISERDGDRLPAPQRGSYSVTCDEWPANLADMSPAELIAALAEVGRETVVKSSNNGAPALAGQWVSVSCYGDPTEPCEMFVVED
jgi:hypothetical protein